MNKYEVYWKSFLIGIIEYNEKTNIMSYNVFETEVAKAEKETNEKIFALAKISQTSSEAIPFFRLKIENLESNNLSYLSYFTDSFTIKKVHV